MKDYEKLWKKLGNIPVNEEEQIDEPFEDFEAGTDVHYIWDWFEEKFNISVGKLMNNIPQ